MHHLPPVGHAIQGGWICPPGGHGAADRHHDHPTRGLVKITKRPCLTARSWPATRTVIRTSPDCTCVGPDRALSTCAFDLLALNGRDPRLQTLMKRLACLRTYWSVSVVRPSRYPNLFETARRCCG